MEVDDGGHARSPIQIENAADHVARIPVYIINATYLWPITLWVYVRHGRPSKPQQSSYDHSEAMQHDQTHDKSEDITMEGHDAYHHHHGGDGPMFATITIAVCHCGAGCVLGDIIGEWSVYGAGITIAGRMLWAEMLIGTVFPVPTCCNSEEYLYLSRRLRFRPVLRHLLSVLLHSPDVRRVRR
jgi:hypothetical protein